MTNIIVSYLTYFDTNSIWYFLKSDQLLASICQVASGAGTNKVLGSSLTRL